MRTKICTRDMVKAREQSTRREPRGFLGFLLGEAQKAGQAGLSGKAFCARAAKRDPRQTPLTYDPKLVKAGTLQSLDNWFTTDLYALGYGVGAVEIKDAKGKLRDKRYFLFAKPGDEAVLATYDARGNRIKADKPRKAAKKAVEPTPEAQDKPDETSPATAPAVAPDAPDTI